MVNKVILVGNLGRDPERRSTPSGQQVATFSVATSRRWRDRDGNRQEQTEWHNVVCWGRQAEVAGEYLKKGRQIYVEGRLADPIVGRQADRREEVPHRGHLRQLPDARPARRRRRRRLLERAGARRAA